MAIVRVWMSYCAGNDFAKAANGVCVRESGMRDTKGDAADRMCIICCDRVEIEDDER